MRRQTGSQLTQTVSAHNLSDETKEGVYEKLLSGTPTWIIIEGTIFSSTWCTV
jgi:hypothetical protein